MNQSGSVRLFVDALSNRYVARIAPMERKGGLGVDWRLNAAVFEIDEGEWVGSAPVYGNITLESLSEEELEKLLELANRRGL